MRHHVRRYGMAGTASAAAAALASRLPIIKEYPLELTVPIILAAFRIIGDLSNRYLKLDGKK